MATSSRPGKMHNNENTLNDLVTKASLVANWHSDEDPDCISNL